MQQAGDQASEETWEYTGVREWGIENGEWGIENGERGIENGEWGIENGELEFFLVPMLQRGNAYYMGSYAGAW